MKKRESILLSISVLVSNRIDTVKKCMESLKPLLEAVSSELIVVDTVGEEQSDGSLEVAKEYATEIVHFDWCNDFSAARNTGLDRAKGEWFMALDDDEWFEDVTEIIDFFQTDEYKKYASATYRIRNYTNFEGTQYNEVPLHRMVKNENVRYVGTVHETFSEIRFPCKDFSAYVHHYGYVYSNEEEKMKHKKRNIVLLEDELKKNPSDMRYRTQMALELASLDNEEALEFCWETFRLFPKRATNSGFQWQLALVFRLYEALGIGAAKARETYQELKEKYGYSEMADLAICFQMVRIYVLSGESSGGYFYAGKYFQLYEYFKEHPEYQQLQRTADFYRYLTENSYLEMLHYGAYCAWKAKEYAMAWQWYLSMPWENCQYDNEEALDLLLGMANENLDLRCLLSILRRIMKNKTMIVRETVRSKVANVLQVLQTEK